MYFPSRRPVFDLHRALTDGKLEFSYGVCPLYHVIMGGESLHVGTSYIMTLKTPQQVSDVAEEMPKITEHSFTEMMRQIDEWDLMYS